MQNLHGLFQLRVLAAGCLIGMNVDHVVGQHAFLLHVDAFHRGDADAGHAEGRAVDEADVARADDVAAGRLADELAQAERADGVGENLGVAERAVVHEHDQRFGPLAVVEVEHEALSAVALAEEGVFAAAEVVEDLVVGIAAAIVADVEHDRFLIEVVRVERAQENVEAGVVHARNVNVTKLALGELRDALGVVRDPALVHQC